jgi:hypothetical protein
VANDSNCAETHFGNHATNLPVLAFVQHKLEPRVLLSIWVARGLC